MADFTQNDLDQIREHGMTTSQVESQINRFIEGFPFMRLIRGASVGDGIIKLSEEEKGELIDIYKSESKELKVVKFVPASGAASRMFKSLFSFMSSQMGNPNQSEAILQDKPVHSFFQGIRDFAFYDSLNSVMGQAGLNLEELLQDEHYAEILQYLLTDKGLNYGDLPKGLLEFHSYEKGTRTPLEEHLVEGAAYARSGDSSSIHFTVSPQHMELFQKKMEEARAGFESDLDINFDVSYSTQKNSTDTIAVDPANVPFREKDGSLLFRPAGHGALLENLNEISADIIFIKNIDNVVPDSRKEDTVDYKMLLGGLLILHRNRIHSYKTQLMDSPSEELMEEVTGYITSQLNTEFDTSPTMENLIAKLDRPLRVCGMVVNTGEPGGGPFWCKNPDGTTSLQIVESSQMDLSDPDQNEILQGSTHFNPVDIIASTKRVGGEEYNLLDHRDEGTGFISSKSKDGKELRAMELPGLWNGSMSDWNTLFVEVPASTFSPVKTVNDLLRDEHQ